MDSGDHVGVWFIHNKTADFVGLKSLLLAIKGVTVMPIHRCTFYNLFVANTVR